MSYLVDAEGRVLQVTDKAASLPTIRDVGPQPVQVGGSVDRAVLTTMFRLRELLPHAAGVTPRELEFGPDTGLTVVPDAGPRVRFGSDQDLDWQVGALVAVRRELDRQGQRPELIDVRFKDRPYAR